MSIELAIEILRYHNSWRRGEYDEQRNTPYEIGQAIDKILEHLGE